MCRAARLALRLALRSAALLFAGAALQAAACDKPVYLSFDTGHMGVAPLVAEVLARHDIKATFFLANETTLDGGSSLDAHWAPWWRARAAEGHAFGSHTWDHWVLRGDAGAGAFTLRPDFGAERGRLLEASAADYCAELRKPAARFAAMTGQAMLPLFRAPAGRTSPALLKAAEACGFKHVGWAPAGFLGDELPSDRFPNTALLEKALRDIRPGDVLVAHLGIRSRKDPWAPAVLEPLVTGLQARGFCFATLRDHPAYRGWIAAHPLQPATTRRP